MNEKYENNSHSHNRITYIYKHKDVHKRLRLLIEANKESNNIKPTPGYLYFLLLATWIHLLHSVLLRAISFVKRLAIISFLITFKHVCSGLPFQTPLQWHTHQSPLYTTKPPQMILPHLILYLCCLYLLMNMLISYPILEHFATHPS